MLDEHAAQLFAKNINMLVPWYLIAAYSYYVDDDPILSDSFFDDMSKTLLAVWDDVEHYHKHYITKDMLEAGTYIGEYPSIVKGAVADLRKRYAPRKKTRKTKKSV